MNEQPSYFSILSANVRYSKELKPNEKLLFSEITALAQSGGYCFASNSYFARLYDVENETVSRWISHLRILGFLQVEIIYDGKRIEQRKLYPVLDAKVGIDKKINTYCEKNQEGIDKKIKRGIDKKVKDNNTSINNTSINRDDETVYQEIIDFYQSNIGQLAPLILEKITNMVDEWLKLNMDEAKDIILLAFEYAIGRQAVNKFSYAQRILDNWRERNLTNLKAIKAERDKKTYKKHKTQTPLPKWMLNDTEFQKIEGPVPTAAELIARLKKLDEMR